MGINLRSDLTGADQVNYKVKKAWKAHHFTMHILKKGSTNTKSLVYTLLVCPILEYGVACWDPYMEGQISVLDQVQRKADKLAHHRNDSAQRRRIACICTLFKAYMGEGAWKAVGDRLQKPCWAGLTMIGKVGAESKGQISENIRL